MFSVQTFRSSSRPTPGGLADGGLADPDAANVGGLDGPVVGAIGRIGATGVVTRAEGIGLTAEIALIDTGWDRSWPAIASEQA